MLRNRLSVATGILSLLSSLYVHAAPPASAAPTVPTAAAAAASSSQINLNWSSSTVKRSTVDSYNIYRNGQLLRSVAGSVRSLADTGLSASTVYSYQVSAHATNGKTSALSTAVSVKTMDVVAPPVVVAAKPTTPILVLAQALSDSQIKINWLAATVAGGTISGYRVFRGGALVATVGGTTLDFTDSNLMASMSYTYQLVAVSSENQISDMTSGLTGMTLATPLPGTGVGTVVGRIPVVGDYNKIPSEFDPMTYLQPAWGSPGYVHAPMDAAPDNVGAFRFICGPSHLGYDDPIVFPGQPGKAHLHQFWGNSLTNANSTYESLRRTGMSTCGSPVNRSAYWIPAMMNGKGKVVTPDLIGMYYKRFPASSPQCNGRSRCTEMPRGLRFIFGANMGTGNLAYHGDYRCIGGAGDDPIKYQTINEAAKNCSMGQQLSFTIDAPVCWDGVNLDSPDHRSHMATWDADGSGQCPVTHPVFIPFLHLAINYTVDADLKGALTSLGNWDGTMNGWHFASDEMRNSEPGTTGHSDYMMAWDDTVLDMFENNCINGLLNCSGGDLGNALQIKGAQQPYPNFMFPNVSSWTTANPVVSPPAGAMPGMEGMPIQ